MALKTERYLKSPGAVDAFQVLNLPIFIRKNPNTTWDAYVLLKPCNSEFSIALGTTTKGQAVEEVKKYIATKFRE